MLYTCQVNNMRSRITASINAPPLTLLIESNNMYQYDREASDLWVISYRDASIGFTRDLYTTSCCAQRTL